MILESIATIRTNNFQDKEVIQKIQQLWRDCQKEVAQAFAGGQPIYAVYHDYVSDFKGDYSLSLCRITDAEGDFDTSQQIYEVFEVNTKDSEGIVHAWQKIWEAEEAGTLKREYSIDFEKYEANQTVTIFVAVNEND